MSRSFPIRVRPSPSRCPARKACLFPGRPASDTVVPTAKTAITQLFPCLYPVASYLAAPAPVSPFPASVLRIPATWASDWSSSQCTLSTPTTTPTISRPRYVFLMLFLKPTHPPLLLSSCLPPSSSPPLPLSPASSLPPPSFHPPLIPEWRWDLMDSWPWLQWFQMTGTSLEFSFLCQCVRVRLSVCACVSLR